jgi:hypothetical protein
MRLLSSIQPRSILLKIDMPEIGKVDIAGLLVNAGMAGRRDSLPSDVGLAETVAAGIHAC